MDSFDSILDASELLKQHPALSPVHNPNNNDDEQLMLVDADTKWSYGGYCVIAWLVHFFVRISECMIMVPVYHFLNHS